MIRRGEQSIWVTQLSIRHCALLIAHGLCHALLTPDKRVVIEQKVLMRSQTGFEHTEPPQPTPIPIARDLLGDSDYQSPIGRFSTLYLSQKVNELQIRSELLHFTLAESVNACTIRNRFER